MRINSITGCKPSFNGISRKMIPNMDNENRSVNPREFLRDGREILLEGKAPAEKVKYNDDRTLIEYPVYLADPYEEITPEIYEKHSYICAYPGLVKLSPVNLDTYLTSASLAGLTNQLNHRVKDTTVLNDFAQQKLAQGVPDKEMETWTKRAEDASKYLLQYTAQLNAAEAKKNALKKIEDLEKAGDKQGALQARIDMLQAQMDSLTAQMEKLQ